MFGRKRGAVIAVATMLAAGLMSLTASAAENHSNDGAAFLRAGVGPRYLAMGKAGTASATDVYAGYWNPAGLAWMRGWQVAGMYTGGLDFDRHHNSAAVGWGGDKFGIALSWINAGTSDIQFADVNGGTSQNNSLFNFGENAVQLSVAKAWDRVALGITGKMVNQDLGVTFGNDDNITGWGMDLGASLKANRYVNFGVVAQDIFTRVGSAQEANDIPAMLRFGAALFPADGLTVSMDLDKVKDDENFRFRGGAEYTLDLTSDLNASLRLGMDRTRFAGGVGFGYDWFNFDYAYVVEPENFQGSNHRLGIILKFGEEKAPTAVTTNDRDHDGIPDDVDKCPDQAEDFDGYQDTDGCPDLDNDGDGIPDAQDQCPNQAEDFDGFEDTDGCPDLDNDKDGILDKDDKCPNAAEDFDGYEDTDGCPEGGAPVCFPVAHINFKFGTAEMVWSDYLPVLNEVADIMNKYPNIKIEIQGHTDNIGSDESNLTLSQKRADAVKDWLVKKGISADRMTTRGYGESKPIDTNDTDLGRARNRRIEFQVVSGLEQQK